MRAIVTGQVGMDKKSYLERAARFAGEAGDRIDLYHVGDMMYAEAPDVRPGRILDLPLSRLNALRRAVFKDVIAESAGQANVIVNTHATFRWRHGLFSAFDFDQLERFKPDMFICLVDNIEVVHHRLHKEHTIDATLKDLMVWREEEIMATELVAQALGCRNKFYVLSRGRHTDTVESCFRLVCQPQMKRVYPSFPMSHVVGMPDVLAEIDAFRAVLAKHFVAFDPGDVDEKLLLDSAIAAAKEGKDLIEMNAGSFSGGQLTIPVSVRQVLDIAGDIDGQIYARDFKLIDQADMIVSLIPELPGGGPGLSSGVERELQHAFEHGKEVYVVWKPRKNPSPFITETATKVFTSVQEAIEEFDRRGMIQPTSLFGH
ncbi:MAG: AAA family ATPase [Phycisphaeraceae bacterium]|nr:AAA family ATPase [Phycisphaeraceae bacterium]